MKEKIEKEFAETLIKKLTEYREALSEQKHVKEREYRHMATAIYGCKLIVQGVLNEGDKYEVKLNQ